LNRFAVHHQTGQPIPRKLVEKIESAKNFNKGFSTVEYMLSAIYDMKIHLAAAGAQPDPAAFEKAIVEEWNAPPGIGLRHRPAHFGHIFSGDGYSAGYYDYLWADALTADAAEAFAQGPGFYDRPLAKKLETTILRVGNSVPPDEAFRRFRGRDVDSNALMRDRGFLK
jgi:peptidyl-dipeptidase Dcp